MPGSEKTDSRQQRQDALSALANGHERATTSAYQHRISSQPHRLAREKGSWRWRFWRVGIVVLVAISIVTGVVIVTLRPHPTPTPTAHAPAPLELLPHISGFDCPQDMVWSPDGKRIALIGYELQCPVEMMQSEYNSGLALAPHDSPIDSVRSLSHTDRPLVGLILVYDSKTGDLLLRAQPDAAIQRLFPIPDSVVQIYASINATPELEIHYTHVLWLPGTDSLAITFTTFVPSGPPPSDSVGQPGAWPGTAVFGVVLADLSGGLRVLSATFPYTGPSRIREWDLTTGRMVPLPPALASQTSVSSIAPGLVYQWGANGALALAEPLPSAGETLPASTLLSPIGSSDGGSRFTIWQAGQLNSTRNGASDAAFYAWAPDFAAISPDGRYLLDAVSLNGQLQPDSGVPQTTLVLPVRDAGLRQFLTTLSNNHVDGTTNAAWRPDGQVFAAQKGGASDSHSPDQHAVLLFDCQTGAPVATLVPFGGGPDAAASGEPNLLTWSPDGSRLFLFDTTLGTATIWTPATPQKS